MRCILEEASVGKVVLDGSVSEGGGVAGKLERQAQGYLALKKQPPP